MFSDDLLSALHKRPFEPFRIQVSDGTNYDVLHPELVMVGLGDVVIGVPPVGQNKPIYKQIETVALSHIVKLLPLGAPPTGNGQQ